VLVLKAMLPSLSCLPVQRERLAEQVEDMYRRGHAVFVSDQVLVPSLAHDPWWAAVVRLCRPMRSRGSRELVLLHYRAGERLSQTLDCFVPSARKGNK
jgi:hypothetical protein